MIYPQLRGYQQKWDSRVVRKQNTITEFAENGHGVPGERLWSQSRGKCTDPSARKKSGPLDDITR